MGKELSKEQYRKNLKELQQSIKSKVNPKQLMRNHPDFVEGWYKNVKTD